MRLNAAMYRSFAMRRMTTNRSPVILLCSDRSQERRTKNNEITTQGEKKEQPAKQTPALATLLYVDWSKENARHQQVNGPPGALPPESVDHGETCQHRMNADRSDLESAGCPFKTSCVVWECRSKSAHQSSSSNHFIVHHTPEKAGKFSGNGRLGDVCFLASEEHTVVFASEALVGSVCVCDDLG